MRWGSTGDPPDVGQLHARAPEREAVDLIFGQAETVGRCVAKTIVAAPRDRTRWPLYYPRVPEPSFMGVHLAVADMGAALAFYRKIGVQLDDGAEGRPHVELNFSNGARVELSTPDVIAMYDPGWRGPSPSTSTVLQFGLPSRAAVDEIYAALTTEGYHGHLPPTDAFWGARYCELDDPDGHTVGFHSPRQETPH